MKKQWLASVAVVALAAASPALAAPPPPVFSWTGFYAGGNAGYSWGSSNTNFTDTGFSEGFGPAGFCCGNLPSSYPSTLKPDGPIGGVQFGYNWQVGPTWVAGIEADFQTSKEESRTWFTNNYSCDTEGPGCSLTQTRDAKIHWFDTLRGRFGWLATPTTWIYATGGLAYGKVSLTGSVFDSNSNTGTSFVFGSSQVKTGYAVGAGIEGILAGSPGFTWKVEYLYIDLGSISGSGFEPISGSLYSWNAKFVDNIIRVGVNYHFH